MKRNYIRHSLTSYLKLRRPAYPVSIVTGCRALLWMACCLETLEKAVDQNPERYMKITAYKNYSTMFVPVGESNPLYARNSPPFRRSQVPGGGRSSDDEEDFLRSYYSNDRRSHSRVTEVTTIRTLSKCLTIRVEVLLKFHQRQSG